MIFSFNVICNKFSKFINLIWRWSHEGIKCLFATFIFSKLPYNFSRGTTVPHLSPDENKTCNFQIHHLMRSDTRQLDIVYHRQSLPHPCHYGPSGHGHQRSRGHAAPSHCWGEHKDISFDTVLPESAVTTSKETSLSFGKLLKAAHTVPKATKDMAGTIVLNASDSIDYKAQPPSKSVSKPPSNT